jgi:hypothetical protein
VREGGADVLMQGQTIAIGKITKLITDPDAPA